MKTDVTTLIAALTSERDSLNLAIAALKQISPAPQAVVTAPTRKVKPVKRTRAFISDDTKRQIVDEMTRARTMGRGAMAATIRRVSKQHGVRPASIQTGWLHWQRQIETPSNGHEPVAPAQEVMAAQIATM